MIDVRAEDDLFTEPNEPKKKEAMELTKTFLSSSIHDVTNNLTGGLKWTL